MIDFAKEAQRSLQRLVPRIETRLPDDPALRRVFLDRLDAHFPAVFRLLHAIYGERYDFFYHLEQILCTAADLYSARPDEEASLGLTKQFKEMGFPKVYIHKEGWHEWLKTGYPIDPK